VAVDTALSVLSKRASKFEEPDQEYLTNLICEASGVLLDSFQHFKEEVSPPLGGNMIRFLGIVIVTEEEMQTIARVDKVYLEALKHDLRIAEAKLGEIPYLRAQFDIFKSRAEESRK